MACSGKEFVFICSLSPDFIEDYGSRYQTNELGRGSFMTVQHTGFVVLTVGCF